MFTKYETDVLLIVHANLENGVQASVDNFISGGPKAGYAADNYHLSLEMLAQVEDELFSRGVDPHKIKEKK